MANDLPAGFSATPPQGDLPQGFSLTPPKAAAPSSDNLPQGFSRFSPNQNAILAGKSPVRHTDSMAQSPAQQIPTYQILGSADAGPRQGQPPTAGQAALDKMTGRQAAPLNMKVEAAQPGEFQKITAPLAQPVLSPETRKKAVQYYGEPATQAIEAAAGLVELPGALWDTATNAAIEAADKTGVLGVLSRVTGQPGYDVEKQKAELGEASGFGAMAAGMVPEAVGASAANSNFRPPRAGPSAAPGRAQAAGQAAVGQALQPARPAAPGKAAGPASREASVSTGRELTEAERLQQQQNQQQQAPGRNNRAVGQPAQGAGGQQPPPPPPPAGGPTIAPGGQRPPPLPPTGQILQAMQAAAPGGPRTTLRGAAQTLARNIGNLFGSTAQPAAKRAMTGINQAVGLSSRASAQTAAALEAFRDVVRKADMQSKLNILDYIETRTVQQRQARGAINTVEINGRHVPVTGTPVGGLLDTFRAAMKQRQSALQAMSRHQQMTFWEDYAKHMWKDPSAAKKFFATASGKEGSTKSLKKRSIPTIADGIRAGLEPVTIDPIEIGVRYVESIDRYIGMRNYFDDARGIGDIKGFMPGKAPDGWTKLETTFQPKGATPMEYYAPDDFARIWNNFTKQGIMDQAGQGLYKNWMAVKAANMAMSFGFSGYHAFAMTRDAFYSDFAKAIGQGMHGDPRAIGSAVVALLAPVRRTLQGRRGLSIYRGQLQGSPVEQQLVDILSRTGARFAGKGRIADEYRFSGSGSYFTSLRKGTLKAELMSDMKTMRDNPLMGVPKVFFKNIGRGLETVMSPLFEYYIPRMKLGASMDTMGAWLKRNPTASMEEQLDMANRIATSIDNRFGEVNQNRMFMNPMLKQIMNGALMSFSWQKGFFSEFLGSPVDAFKHGRDSTKLQYTIAVALGAPMLNSVEQYFRTGQWPWQTNTTKTDLYFPRTGGTNPDGSPQRIVQPDDIRTIFGWAMHPFTEAYNVLATPIHTGVDLAVGKTWSKTPQGKNKYGPIAPKGASWPKWLEAYLQVVANSFEPFVIAQENAPKGAKNAIGGVGTFLGQRPAGTAIANPARQKQIDDWLKYGPQKRPHYGGTY